MKKLNNLLISGFISFSLTIAPIQPVKATGIPVVDVAHITQTLVGYALSLNEYAEMIAQGLIEASELAQLVDSYKQKLIEYDSYLNQLRALRDVVDIAVWQDLLNAVATIDYGNLDISLIPELDPEDEDYTRDLIRLVSENNTVPYMTDHVINSMGNLGAAQKMKNKIGRTNSRLKKKHRVYENQLSSVALNKLASDKRMEAIQEAKNDLSDLGEESDLATLQMIASQQILQAQQNEALVKVMNDLLMNYESPSLTQTRNEIEALDQKIALLKAKQRTNLVSNTFTEDCDDNNADIDDDCDLSGVEID